MGNRRLGDRITEALSECEDSILEVGETLGTVLGMWVAEVSRSTGATPDEVRAIVDAALVRSISEALAEPRLFDA